MSKSPWSRSVFERSFGHDSIYLQVLRATTCARVIDDPARPAREAMQYLSGDRSTYSRVKSGQDVELRITIRDDPKEKEDTPEQALLRFLRMVKREEVTDEMLQHYVCGSFGNHEWKEFTVKVEQIYPEKTDAPV